MENWEKKKKVLRVKSIPTEKCHEDKNLYKRLHRYLQKYIKEIEKTEKNKGKEKMGYKKLTINNRKWEWNKETQQLVETRSIHTKKLETRQIKMNKNLTTRRQRRIKTKREK